MDETKFMSCMIVELHKNPCVHSLMSETLASFKQKFHNIHFWSSTSFLVF